MSRMGMWTRIPDKSWVKVWVEAKQGDDDPGFVASGDFHSDTGHDDELPDLHLAPRRRILRAPSNYTIRIPIAFAKRSTAFALAEVTTEDGTPIPETFSGQIEWRSNPVTGNPGSVKSVTLFLVTEGEPGGDLG